MADCIYRLALAVAIQNAERDPSRWPAMVDALPEEARKPVRLWLADYARRARYVRFQSRHAPVAARRIAARG